MHLWDLNEVSAPLNNIETYTNYTHGRKNVGNKMAELFLKEIPFAAILS